MNDIVQTMDELFQLCLGEIIPFIANWYILADRNLYL